MVRSTVAIIVPAFNEVAGIEKVVKKLHAYGTPVVVDDASTDGTGLAAKNAGALVVIHDENRGYDEALNSGFVQAELIDAKYVITFDGDGQHPSNIISEFISMLEKGADIVIGIRSHKARLAEKVFGWITQLRYGINDPLCGMKGYRMTLYRDAGCFDSYGSIGTQLMLFALKNSYQISQVGVPIQERENGLPRFGTAFWANWRIFRSFFMGLMIHSYKLK